MKRFAQCLAELQAAAWAVRHVLEGEENPAAHEANRQLLAAWEDAMVDAALWAPFATRDRLSMRIGRACDECLKPHGGLFMVTDEVWSKVMPHGRGHLHLACLEKRLGRPITADDLTPARCNADLRVVLGRVAKPPEEPPDCEAAASSAEVRAAAS